jgi:acetyl esterase/lipase
LLILYYIIQASNHLTELDINPHLGFLIGGISAGANLAAVAAHLYTSEKRTPLLTGQYLSIPTICEPAAVPAEHKTAYLSREQNKDALILNQKSINTFEGTSCQIPSLPLSTVAMYV